MSPESINEDPFTAGASGQMSTTANAKRNSGLGGQTSPNQKGGGIPRLSPTKLAGDFSRLSIDEKAQRISMSPRAIGSRKEALTPKNSTVQDPKPLQVYEDPVRSPVNASPYPPPLTHVPRALEELPVNEPTKQRGIFDHQLLAEEPKGLDYHQNWLAMESQERQRASTSENTENPALARKILNSGIDRVRARTLDVHGFRKLQTLIRTSGDSIWEGGYKFDELLLPLLDYLESPNDDSTPRSAKAQDLKTQVLVTVRSLLQHQPDYFSGYYPRAISAVLATRKQYTSTSHIVCGLEDTAEAIIAKCDPEKCIDAVLDFLETERSEGAETMGLYVLAGLLHRGQEKDGGLLLTEQQEERLGRMGARCLADTNPDIRRAVIEFVLELHDAVEKDRFWGLVAKGRDDHRSLITYYLARKRATVQQ
jgi:CLIP-associating protein 1/2